MRGGRDPVVDLMTELRSPDVARVRQALAGPIVVDVAAQLVELVGRDDVGREAVAALGPLAPACTGVLADALLDQHRPPALRRRIPAVLVLGEPTLAAWALWRSLADPDFDVRYRAGAVLSRLAAEGHLPQVSQDDVFAAVRRELVGDPIEWKARQVVEDLVVVAQVGEDEVRSPSGLEHVFRVLGLALPAEPLRIALHAVQTDDPALRGTALEYLESILPADVRAQLWPLLETEQDNVVAAIAAAPSEVPIQAAAPAPAPSARPPRSMDELVADLSGSYPAVIARLKQRRAG
jgi:hypothetical protein